ncbi:acetolactate synthase [Klebsiella pneumoniae]|uniref:Acetolactate synthase n=1 Tax=Klebsiella pneumoniae TaxID=573 RepID=A0A377XCF7_KLEPN|nr:acetolactate synthase [Klebsiella pneumoniae]
MDKQYPVRQWAHGADLVVSQLEAQGVRQVFGIPGAKIDKVFDSLLDSSIRIISGAPRSQRRVYGRRRRTYYRQSGRGAGHLRSGLF